MFEHTQVALPEDATFKISPSGISKFFDSPVLWYKEHILGEKEFQGNTATTVGTLVHYCAEQKILGQPIDYNLINEEIRKIDNPDVDKEEVMSAWEIQKDVLFDEYLNHQTIDEAEAQLCHKVKEGVYVAGSCDARQGSTVIDFKNVSKKPRDTIPFNYFIQLMAYAYMYKQQGVFIDKIQLVYTVRPTKTLPARLIVVSQLIKDEDWEMIENTLELIADTVLKSRECPELNYLLFKSMQFKEKEKPILFKKEN